MQNIAFIDTETTSLRPDRRAWEVAIILRSDGESDRSEVWMVDAVDLDLGNADQASLNIGGFYERHPDFCHSGSPADPFGGDGPLLEYSVMIDVERMTRGAILAGSNPSFDAEVLAARMRAHGIAPSWHYHSLDVPTLALGWLHGARRDIPETPKSDAISRECDIDPERYERHTALGDCCWMRDLYDTVTVHRRLGEKRPTN